MSETESDQYGEFEEKKDELWKGLLTAYAAGYARAVQAHGCDAPSDYQTLRDSEWISESHYSFWDGRILPLEFWLREQFGLNTDESENGRDSDR